jgi:NTP pyrophosphatase (non-canonical NTP hydrolase)
MLLSEYQQRAVSTAIYPDKGKIGGLVYTALKLNGEAGEVAEKVGKILRDDSGVLTLEKREALIKELGDVLWYVAATARELNVELETVAEQNLNKLADRKARGVLQGSGDSR